MQSIINQTRTVEEIYSDILTTKKVLFNAYDELESVNEAYLHLSRHYDKRKYKTKSLQHSAKLFCDYCNSLSDYKKLKKEFKAISTKRNKLRNLIDRYNKLLNSLFQELTLSRA